MLTQKTVDKATASPGEQLSYTINFTCSNNDGDLPLDGCDGAAFADPIPQLANVYGEPIPLEFVSASGPAGVWPTGFAVDSTDPANPVVRGTAGTWAPGTSGVISVVLRVPRNALETGTQTITNVATVTDPETSNVSTTPQAVTTVTTSAPVWTVSKTGPAANGTALRQNRTYGWTVSVCAADVNSAPWQIFTIDDVVPAGFRVLSTAHGGVYTDDGLPSDDISDGAGTISWRFDETNRPPIGSDGCIRLNVTGSFPSAHASNVADAVKENTATAQGFAHASAVAVDLGTAKTNHTLSGPQFGSLGTSKTVTDAAGNSNYFVLDGDVAQFRLSTSVDSDYLLDRVELFDGAWAYNDGVAPQQTGIGFPETFVISSVTPGTWNDPTAATIQTSIDGTTWTDLATGVASGGTDIPVAATVRFVRWVWDNPAAIRGDFASTGQRINGTIDGDPGDFGRYTNTSTLTVTPAGDVVRTATDSDDYVLESALPHAGITKSASPTSIQPGQRSTFTLRVNNSGDATGDLVDPVVTDCVPAGLTLEETTAAAPWTTATLPTCGVGETPVAYQWIGTLQPGQQTTTIAFVVEAPGAETGDPAAYGSYPNTAYVAPTGGGSFGHCQSAGCSASATVTVTPTIQLDSSKCVRGQLDGSVFRPTPRCTTGEAAVEAAQTTPGGIIEYQLNVVNVGNVDTENLQFVDIFPRVGDTAVISGTPLNPRHSEYRPLLVDTITPPAGWTVEYSTATNPCRGEVGGPTTGCQSANWTTAADQLALSTYNSVRFSHPGVLARGATASFVWQMRAPVIDSSYDKGGSDDANPYEFLATCSPTAPRSDASHCPRAVNSFAYGADAANVIPALRPGRLYAEPPQVEVRVQLPATSNSIGDRVWFDANFDGIQDAGESGIGNVRVELLDDQGDVIAITFTDTDGRYRFTHIGPEGAQYPLPSGSYQVRMYPPAGYLVSPADRSGVGTDAGAANTDDDSDFARVATGTNATGVYHDSVMIELGDPGDPGVSETDLSWDLGLWRAAPSVGIDKVTKDTAWPDTEYGDGVRVITARPVTWRYTVTNTGNARLHNVSIGDNNGGGAAVPFAVTSCTITDDGHNADGLASSSTAPIALNRGAVMVCTATGTAQAADYSNTATVTGTPVADDGSSLGTGPSGHPVPATVTNADTSSYVVDRYDLALAKTTDSVNLATGEVSFDIVLANQGTLSSGNYEVTDWLPEGMSFVSSVPAPTSVSGDAATGTTLIWDLSGLAASAQRTIRVNATIDEYLAGPFRNVAEISADGAGDVVTGGVNTPTADVDSTPDSNPLNDGAYGLIGEGLPIDNASIADAGVGADARPLGEDDADIADVVPSITYDLALVKNASLTPATADDPALITWSITVANQGNVPSGGFTVTDHVPAGLTVTNPAGGVTVTNLDGTSTVTIAAANLAPGATRTYQIVTEVTEPGLRPFRNIAEISSDSAQALYGVDDVDSTPDLDPNNDGNYGPLGSPDSALDNLAIADAGTGSDPEDDADFAEVGFHVTYDLALSKTADRTTMVYADTVTYTITVQNQGLLASRQFTVGDIIPEGMAVVAGSVSHGGVITSTGIDWTIANLDPGQSLQLTFAAKITDLTKRPYRNYAEITSDSAHTWDIPGEIIADIDSTPDADPTNDGDYGPVGASDPAVDNASINDAGNGADPEDDADVADVVVDVRYDLALVKTVGSPTMAYDGVAEFRVTVANQGNVPSGRFTVRDDIPEGLGVVDASHGGVTSADGRTVTWTDLASIEPGATVQLVIRTKVTDITKRPYRNVAEITSDGAAELSTVNETVADIDSVPGDVETSTADNTSLSEAGVGDDVGFDDEDIADVTVDVVYDLEIAKRLVAGQRYVVGGPVVYEITVSNTGNVPSGLFTFADTLPPGMSFVSATHGGTAQGNVVTWADQASIAPNTALTVSVTTRLDDGTLASYRNWVQINADSADTYSTPWLRVTDADSNPDNGVLGTAAEDDDAFVEIPIDEIEVAGAGERRGASPGASPLAFTGASTLLLVLAGLVLTVIGMAIVGIGRRRFAR